MLRGGADPLVKSIRGRVGKAPIERLLAGLSPETVQRAACAWAANREHEPPGASPAAGWKAEALDLRYGGAGHADPVLKAWIEFAATAPSAAAEALRKEMLSAAEGPGSCAKCHIVSGPAGAATVAWTYRFGDFRPHTRFSHRPHIDLLGPEKNCTACHRLATPARGATPGGTTAGAFQPIAVAACVECHSPGKVNDSCRLCHVYHRDHALKIRMSGDAR